MKYDQTNPQWHAPLETDTDIAAHLAALLVQVPSLASIAEIAGPLPLRRTPPGLPSLVRIVCGQQVSTHAAASIFNRLEAGLGRITAKALLDAGLEGLQALGLSTPKCKTLLNVAHAMADDRLDLHRLCVLPADKALEELVALKGIGPWTAEVYLLFAAGHPDIFPSGDLALQNAVQHGLCREASLNAKALAILAEQWAPHRGVAARLFWAYYAAIKGREGV